MKAFVRTKLFAITTLSFILIGCSSPSPKPETGAGTSIDSEDTAATSEGNMPPETSRIPIGEGGVQYGKWDNVHFDYDSAMVRSEDRKTLEEIAQWAKGNPEKKIMVAGHCDERGTLEYNRALGQRRASAARAYLIKLGASANNVGTVSYGEERSLDNGHNEEAWAKNRRAEFGVVQ